MAAASAQTTAPTSYPAETDKTQNPRRPSEIPSRTRSGTCLQIASSKISRAPDNATAYRSDRATPRTSRNSRPRRSSAPPARADGPAVRRGQSPCPAQTPCSRPCHGPISPPLTPLGSLSCGVEDPQEGLRGGIGHVRHGGRVKVAAFSGRRRSVACSWTCRGCEALRTDTVEVDDEAHSVVRPHSDTRRGGK